MFILTKISDLVQITPQDFSKPSLEAIEHNINEKYSNKVIQKIGLCICLYDLLSASEGLIGHGTGIVNVNVEFRLVVFRPFRHEILNGMISSSNHLGIRIRTPFFDDFFVPREYLPENSYFDATTQVWIWPVYDEEQDPETTDPRDAANSLYFDNHEPVRFRVEGEKWEDQSPIGPRDEMEGVEKKSPYSIIGSMTGTNLGACAWWDSPDEVGEPGAMDIDADQA